MVTNRLFFALLPSNDVRDACEKAAKDIKVKNQTNGRLSDPNDYHLTVLFLGDQVTPEDESKAIALMNKLSGDPIEFTLNFASGFKEAKVWWLGMNDIPGQLAELRALVKDVTTSHGLASDRRRFAPHVTILRGADAWLPQTRISPIQWLSADLVLMRSRLDQNPRSYEELARVPLAGAKRVKAMEQISLL